MVIPAKFPPRLLESLYPSAVAAGLCQACSWFNLMQQISAGTLKTWQCAGPRGELDLIFIPPNIFKDTIQIRYIREKKTNRACSTTCFALCFPGFSSIRFHLLPLSWFCFLIVSSKNSRDNSQAMFLWHLLESVLRSELITYHLKKAVTGGSGWDTGSDLHLIVVQEILTERKNYLIYRRRIAKWSACFFFNIRMPEFNMWPCHLQWHYGRVSWPQSLSVFICQIRVMIIIMPKLRVVMRFKQ